jgi:DNA-binding transcriptional ArsR family regulator
MSTRPQLSGPIHAVPVDDESERLVREIEKLREKLEDSRDELNKMATTVDALLMRLRPLHQVLNSIFDGDAPTPAQTFSSSGPTPHNRDAWNAWKQQLPDSCGKVIDVLLVQPLKASQMIALCKLAYPTITQALRILERNGLVEKDGRVIKLKRL